MQGLIQATGFHILFSEFLLYRCRDILCLALNKSYLFVFLMQLMGVGLTGLHGHSVQWRAGRVTWHEPGGVSYLGQSMEEARARARTWMRLTAWTPTAQVINEIQFIYTYQLLPWWWIY